MTLRVIDGRWKVVILHYRVPDTKRFNELQRLLKGVSHRTPAQQLRELQRDGIVDRKVYPQFPLKVEYSLTRIGKCLEPFLLAMHDWGEVYAKRSRKA